MNKTKRYIVQFVMPVNKKNYIVYDVIEKRVIDRYNNYPDALNICDMLNKTNEHGWEPILSQQEMRLD